MQFFACLGRCQSIIVLAWLDTAGPTGHGSNNGAGTMTQPLMGKLIVGCDVWANKKWLSNNGSVLWLLFTALPSQMIRGVTSGQLEDRTRNNNRINQRQQKQRQAEEVAEKLRYDGGRLAVSL